MSVTLATLRTEVLRRADMVGSDFLTDAEVNSYINSSAAELYDLLVGVYEDQYTLSDVTATPQSSPLPMSSPAFSAMVGALDVAGKPLFLLKLRRIEYRDSAGKWRKLRRVSLNEWDHFNRSYSNGYPTAYTLIGESLHVLPEDVSSQTYRIWYVPGYLPMLVDADTMDNMQQWHEYVIVDAAIKCLQKEESFDAVTALMSQKSALKQRIESAAAIRDAGEPMQIIDATDAWNSWDIR